MVWPMVPIAGAGKQSTVETIWTVFVIEPGKASVQTFEILEDRCRDWLISQPLEGGPVYVSLLIKPATYLWGTRVGVGGGGRDGVCFFLSTLPILCVQGPVCEPTAM